MHYNYKYITLDTFKYKIWCDDGCLVLTVYLEVDESIVGNAFWETHRCCAKKNGGAHINVAGLEAVLQGIKL